jgi:hypothetical protein
MKVQRQVISVLIRDLLAVLDLLALSLAKPL